MLVLALVAGLAGGVVTGAVAVAERTATAYDRLVAATHLDDARVTVFDEGIDVAAIERWPGVEQTWTSRQVLGGIVDAPVAFLSISVGPPRSDDLFTPIIVEGRAPRDDAPYEVMIPAVLAEEAGLRLGQTIPLKLLTPEEVTQFDTGFGQPDGPRINLKVVGIARIPRQWLGAGVGPVFGSSALRERVADYFVGHNVMLRLDDGPAAVEAVKHRVEQLEASAPTSGTGEEFGVAAAEYPSSDKDPEITAAASTLVGGQTVFLGVALVAGLVAIGQALGRHHGNDAEEQRVEAALGLTRGERVLARLVPAAAAAVIAGLLALVGGLVAGRLEPLGALRQYEPTPGFRVVPGVVTTGAVLTALAFVAIAALTAARATRSAVVSEPVVTPVTLSAVARRAPLAAGLAFALRGGRGRGAVPVGATLAVVILGLAGVVAVASFSSSLSRLEREPARYGWVADFNIIDTQPRDLADLAADDRIAAIVDIALAPVRVDGRRINGLGAKELKGDVPLTIIDGRLPARDIETSLSIQAAELFGAGIGSRLPLRLANGDTRNLTVVGLFVNPFGNASGGEAMLTVRTLEAARTTTAFSQAMVQAADGVDVGALYAELAQTREMFRAAPPPDVRHLSSLGRLPLLLGAFLGLLVAVVLAHSLVLTVRRRAGELAVLRAIGLTPGQVAGSLVVMAATVAGAGLLLGTALGLAVGRVVWGEVARGIGVAGDLAVPWLTLGLSIPVVLAGTAALALLPARRAARLRPAAVLHAE
jgi:hypothetical protein